MHFKTKDLLEKSIKAIEENNLFFIEDVIAFLPCGRTTFYNHELDKVDELKELINSASISLRRS